MTPLKTAGRGRPDEGKPARWRVYHALMRARGRAGKTAGVGVGVALARPDETRLVETVELERGGADQREERGGAAAHDDERCAAGQERERGAVDREQLDLQRHDETSTRPGETASFAKSAAAQETPVEEKNNDAPVDAGCDEKNTAALPKDGAHDDDMKRGPSPRCTGLRAAPPGPCTSTSDETPAKVS